jgi:hypothetical protein
MAEFADSDKAKWPLIRGREDQEVQCYFYTSSPADTVNFTNALNISGWSGFTWAAHTDDDTSPTDVPLVDGAANYVPSAGNNQLQVTLTSSDTETLQESGALRGKLTVFGRDATGNRKRLLEAVWVIDRSVSVSL